MTKRINGRMSDAEKELRRYHRDVKKLKKLCEEHEIVLKSYDEALNDDICVLSKNDYEIGACKEYLDDSNEPYFVHEQEFTTTQSLLGYE